MYGHESDEQWAISGRVFAVHTVVRRGFEDVFGWFSFSFPSLVIWFSDTYSFVLFLPGLNILIVIASYHIILISIIFSLSCMFVSCIEHLSSLAKS